MDNLSQTYRLLKTLPLLFVLTLTACSEPPAEAPFSQRLVDVFTPEMTSGSPAAPKAEPPTDVRFDGTLPDPPPEVAPATRGFEALRGVSGLAVEDGLLVATATTPYPTLRLTRSSGLAEQDLVHAIEVRLRSSVDGELKAHYVGPIENDLDRAIQVSDSLPWLIRAPVKASEELQTVSLKPFVPVRGGEIRKLLLQLDQSAGARFAIESVRFLLRREHLASIPTGIGWHDLTEAFLETVVARSPETIRWPVELARHQQLELSLGTLDDRPVTFHVTLRPEGGEETTLLERTVTTPQQWDRATLALDPSLPAGRAELTLALAAEDGALGLWGTPVVRRRDAVPPREAGTGGTPPQGVIFILGDTLRPDRLDVYGHERPTAPFLRRLAGEGARFTDVVAQGAWTKVSAPAILTSLYPTTSKVRDFLDRVPISATTLAEVYRQAGYATVGYSAVPFTGKFSNLHQGYEEMHERAFSPHSSKTARHFVDLFLPWLEDHRDVPFFAFLHFFDPHNPYRPESPYDVLWSDPAALREHERQANLLRQQIDDPLRQIGAMGTREEMVAAGLDPELYVAQDLAAYDGSIRAMDVEIERVFQRLAELGLDDRTLVVFTSDHGEEFLDHGSTFHAQSVYGELTHVPMILWYPEMVPAGVTIEETVQLIDLMPTLLELSGREAPAQVQGQSAVPLLTAAAGNDAKSGRDPERRWQPRPAISEKPTSDSPMVPPPRDTESFALIHDGWKLIHNTQRPDGAPEHELYDHRADPRDQHDVAAEHPEVVERLAKMLASWHETAVSQRLPDDETAQEGLDPEELARLRALGYVQ